MSGKEGLMEYCIWCPTLEETEYLFVIVTFTFFEETGVLCVEESAAAADSIYLVVDHLCRCDSCRVVFLQTSAVPD